MYSKRFAQCMYNALYNNLLYTVLGISLQGTVYCMHTELHVKRIYIIIRDGHGPGRPRAGPANPGPRAVRAETGLKIFI